MIPCPAVAILCGLIPCAITQSFCTKSMLGKSVMHYNGEGYRTFLLIQLYLNFVVIVYFAVVATICKLQVYVTLFPTLAAEFFHWLSTLQYTGICMKIEH